MRTRTCLWVCIQIMALTGCDESAVCPLIAHPRVRGTIVDEHGEGMLPDRVMLLGKEAHECEIYPQSFQTEDDGRPTFLCYPQGDTLLIYRGDEVMQVAVPQGKDPCGSDYPVLEIEWKPE